MHRYLVVANQTLHGADLREELRKRIKSGPCSYFVLVPNTSAADYDADAVATVLSHPGTWWWSTDYAGPATDEEATVQARQRLKQMLGNLAALDLPVEAQLGSSDQLEAMKKYPPIISSTRSSWLLCPGESRAGSRLTSRVRPSAGSAYPSRRSS